MTISTPVPYQQSNPTRNAYETELWMDLASVVYGSHDATETLTIPMPVKGRLQITAHMQLTGGSGGTGFIVVDGANITPGGSVTHDGTLTIHNFIDLNPGIHTLAITSSATIVGAVFTARRGRIPPTI